MQKISKLIACMLTIAVIAGSCNKDDDDMFIGHGSIIWEETTYQLDYADVNKKMKTIIMADSSEIYEYSINLHSKNNANIVEIIILEDDKPLPELSGEYTILSYNIKVKNNRIQCVLSIFRTFSGYDYTLPYYLEITEHKDNRYSLKLNTDDGSEFIKWEGHFKFLQ
ncbi:MAG: hypothetical protein LBP83_08865 [Dysgonamonadaceae bacterium]|jgi:hypothetical protein|nr:hypothetical protein [Dysgonamonadaceae bacterium]